MIIGILLTLSISTALTSLIIIFTSTKGILRENLATGAVIGTTQATSYATTTLIISLVAIFALILILKKQ